MTIEQAELSWLTVMYDHAEEECECKGNSSGGNCRSCFARMYVMEQLYGEDEAENMIYGELPFLPTTSMEMEDREGYVLLNDGVWVPIQDVDLYIDDPDEIDSIIETFMN